MQRISVVAVLVTTGLITLSLVAATSSRLWAQSGSPNPLSGELKQLYLFTRINLMRAAEKMPEADYGFKPAPAVKTFGEEVAHAAEFQSLICGAAKGEQVPNPAAGKTSKADLITALKASSDYCDAVYDSMTDATLGQTVKLIGRDFSKQGALYFNAMHNNETYGTMVPYMRMRNILPPSSEPRGAAQKQ